MARILVVDDQAHARAAMLVVLRANGFDAVGSEDGASALRAFEEADFDLAIVDVYMPGVDGVQLIKTLRQRSPRLPIVAISGMMLRESTRTALHYFPDLPALADVTCLQKPFRAPDLMKAVHEAMAIAA